MLSNGEMLKLSIGDQFLGWRVYGIDQTSVHVQNGKNQEILRRHLIFWLPHKWSATDDEKENGEFNEFVGVVFATVEVLEVDTEGDFAVGVCKYTDDAANLLAYCRSNRDREGDGTGTCTCIDEKGDDWREDDPDLDQSGYA